MDKCFEQSLIRFAHDLHMVLQSVREPEDLHHQRNLVPVHVGLFGLVMPGDHGTDRVGDLPHIHDVCAEHRVIKVEHLALVAV